MGRPVGRMAGRSRSKMACLIAVILPDGFVVPYVEVAATDAERRRGLGGRESVDSSQGMLFVFDFFGSHPIWMKAMLVPIDVLWLDAGQFVRAFGTLQPGSMMPQDGGCKSLHVLELAAGQCVAHGVTIGSQLGFMQTP